MSFESFFKLKIKARLEALSTFLRRSASELASLEMSPSTVQFGSAILDKWLAPGISELNQAEIPDIAGKFPEEHHWLANNFLNNAFGSHQYNDRWRQAAIGFLFRTQNAFRAYHRARSKTLECIELFKPGRPATRCYFDAVGEWEIVLLNIQIALDLFRKFMSPDHPMTDDGRRIGKAANRLKHFGEDLRDGIHAAELTLPVWLDASGLNTTSASVSYAELAENLLEMGKACDILQNPSFIPPPAEAQES